MSRLLTIEDLGPSIFNRESLIVSSITNVGEGYQYTDDSFRKGPYFVQLYDEVFPEPLHYNSSLTSFRYRVAEYLDKYGFWLIDFSPEDIERLKKEITSVIILYEDTDGGFSKQNVFKDTLEGMRQAAFAKNLQPGLKGIRGKICLSEGKIIYAEEEGETK